MRKLIRNFIGNGIKAKIINGVFWTFLGTFVSKGITLLSFVFIARILSVEDYGKIGILRSLVLTFTLFSLASFGVTATKYLAIYKDTNKEDASKILSLTRVFVLILSLLILIITYLFSPYIAVHIVGDSNLVIEVKICAFSIFFAALNGFQAGALAGFEKFKEISIINIVNGLLSVPLLIFSAKYYGVIGVITGILVTNFLLWFISAYFLMKVVKEEEIYFSLKKLNKEYIILKDFSLPSFLSSLMLSPIVLICNSMLVHSKDGFEKMGLFNAAFNYSNIVITVITIISQVFYPFSMRMYGKENKRFDFVNLLLPWFIGIFLCLPILIFPDLASIIFGRQYSSIQMYYTTTFVILFTIIIAYGCGIAINFAASNYMWWNFLHNIVWGVLSIIACKLLIDYGSSGRALAFVISYGLTSIIFLKLYVRKKIAKIELLLNWRVLAIVFLIILSSSLYYINSNIMMRLTFLIFLIFVFVKLFWSWWKQYIN